MAVGNILGQMPGVQSVNNVEADTTGNVALDAQNTDFVSATTPVFKGNADMKSHKVTNVGDPVENGDSVNLKYFKDNSMKMELIWTNQTPTAPFAAQAVTTSVPPSEFDLLCVTGMSWPAENYGLVSTIAPVNTQIKNLLFANDDTDGFWWRTFTIKALTVNFATGRYKAWKDQPENLNNGMIPYQIYGIKFQKNN